MPLTVGAVATMKEPVLLRQTALMAFLPNLAASTFLQDAGLVLVKVLFFAMAHLLTFAAVTVWTTAPLLTQFAKVLSWAGVGRLQEAGPRV